MSRLLNNIGYFLLRLLATLFGLLPSKVQYGFSDFVGFILHRVVRYRISVVRENLKNSFVDKSNKWLRGVERDFYRYIADVFIETILLSTLSKKQMKERMVFVNNRQINDWIDEAGMVIIATAHYASWEYLMIFGSCTTARSYGVYHPLSSSVMERYYYNARSRYGTVPLPMASVAKQIISDKSKNIKSLYALIADQTPTKGIIKNWIMFLNQPTAFFTGMERLALKYKMPVIFFDVKRVKRGYYQTEATLIYDGKEIVDENEITFRYVKMLENKIVEEPHLWLWSHRRWKHMPEDDSKILTINK